MITRESLLEKINALPPYRISEIEDFVDFIASRTPERSNVSDSNSDLTDEQKDAMIARFATEFGGTEYDRDEALQEAALEAIAQPSEVRH